MHQVCCYQFNRASKEYDVCAMKKERTTKSEDLLGNLPENSPENSPQNPPENLPKPKEGYLCKFCGKGFYSTDALNSHIGKMHKDVRKQTTTESSFGVSGLEEIGEAKNFAQSLINVGVKSGLAGQVAKIWAKGDINSIEWTEYILKKVGIDTPKRELILMEYFGEQYDDFLKSYSKGYSGGEIRMTEEDKKPLSKKIEEVTDETIQMFRLQNARRLGAIGADGVSTIEPQIVKVPIIDPNTGQPKLDDKGNPVYTYRTILPGEREERGSWVDDILKLKFANQILSPQQTSNPEVEMLKKEIENLKREKETKERDERLISDVKKMVGDAVKPLLEKIAKIEGGIESTPREHPSDTFLKGMEKTFDILTKAKETINPTPPSNPEIDKMKIDLDKWKAEKELTLAMHRLEREDKLTEMNKKTENIKTITEAAKPLIQQLGQAVGSAIRSKFGKYTPSPYGQYIPYEQQEDLQQEYTEQKKQTLQITNELQKGLSERLKQKNQEEHPPITN